MILFGHENPNQLCSLSMKQCFKCSLMLLLSILYSCTSREDKMKENMKKYVSERINEPGSLEDVSFSPLKKERYLTSLDSSIDIGAEINGLFDIAGFQAYVDTLNSIYPEYSKNNLKDLEDIKSRKLEYYSIKYKFRLKGKAGKTLREFEFKVDSLGKVIDADDISENIE